MMFRRRSTIIILSATLMSAVFANAKDSDNVSLRFVGANSEARKLSAQTPGYDTYFFRNNSAIEKDTQEIDSESQSLARSLFLDIYPGVDVANFANESSMEYVFVANPGADPSLIELSFDNIQTINQDFGGNLKIVIGKNTILISPPVLFLEENNKKTLISGKYKIGYGNKIFIEPGPEYNDLTKKLNNTKFNIVPSGGQPGGPRYPFFVSKTETSCDQFMSFLNDAQANAKTPLGSNMFFDSNGNVWFNQAAKVNRDEMFTLSESKLIYDPSKPKGSRYMHIKTKDGDTPFANHPISGLSWYGSLKYCNWLTIKSGRSVAECCYSEGTNALDWAPVTATNWANGYFGDDERSLWLTLKGIRLPMVDCKGSSITTNKFNEFYKFAAWHRNGNTTYGFGRNETDGKDANTDRAEWSRIQTMATGYFNGETILSASAHTRINENIFGLYDVTGNISEWCNDSGNPGSLQNRYLCGGGWNEKITPVSEAELIPPYDTTHSGGFRTSTTYLPNQKLYIHVLLSFFAEPVESPPKQTEDATQYKTEKKTNKLEDHKGTNIQNKHIASVAYVSPQPSPPPSEPTEPKGKPGKQPPPTTLAVIRTNTLTIASINPNFGVSIAVSTNDIDGNNDGITSFNRKYKSTESVTLSAPALIGNNVFRWWDVSGSIYANTNASISMSSDKTATAVYATPVTLTIQSQTPGSGVPITVSTNDLSGNNNGSTTFNRTYRYGTSVGLTAPDQDSGNYFRWWDISGTIYTNTSINVNMTADTTVTAVYAPPVILTVNSALPNSGVNIQVDTPDIAGNTNGATSFTRTYKIGSSVTLTAPPNVGGNIFFNWTRFGIPLSTQRVVNVNMTMNTTVRANYNNLPLGVSLAFNPVTINLGGSSTLTATPVGGTGIYLNFEYEYDNHYVWHPAWHSSSFSGTTNTRSYDHYIKYRVRVTDSSATVSPWSNEAFLQVNNYTNALPPYLSDSGTL